MRQRCFTLLLALLAWIVVPAAPRVVSSGPTSAAQAAVGHGAPAAIDRGSDRTDRRARPESRHDALPDAAITSLPTASSASFLLLSDREATLVARPLVAALPRGPPLA